MSPIRSDNSDVEEYVKDVTERVHKFEDIKLGGLYSDYVGRTFFSPDEIFGRRLAEAMLRLAEGRLRVINDVEKTTLGKIKDVDIEKIKKIRRILFSH